MTKAATKTATQRDWALWPDNIFGSRFCSSPHPSAPHVYCRRQPGHPGDHAAYVHKISQPESWPA